MAKLLTLKHDDGASYIAARINGHVMMIRCPNIITKERANEMILGMENRFNEYLAQQTTIRKLEEFFS